MVANSYAVTSNAPSQSDLTTLVGLAEEVEVLVARAESFEQMARSHADFLDGPEPEEKASPSVAPVPAGQVAHLRAKLQRLGALFNAIGHAQGRISRSLGQ